MGKLQLLALLISTQLLSMVSTMGSASALAIYSPITVQVQIKYATDTLYPAHGNTAQQPRSPIVIFTAAVTPDRLKELEVMKEINAMELRLKQQDPHKIKEQNKRKAWDRRVRQQIRQNSIISGMKPEHVLQSWGPPTQVETLGESTQKWIYQRKDGRNQIILFDLGEVVGWE